MYLPPEPLSFSAKNGDDFLCLYDMRVTENHVYLQQLIKDTANEK